MKKPVIAIVTPALAAANNGNWQTARRWSHLLAHDYQVHLTDCWPVPGPGAGATAATLGGAQLMIALHARRSAASVLAWRGLHPTRPLLLVLTGTDLYRDIQTDPLAQRSLQLADRLVVLNELGAADLPREHHAKTTVCLQSSPSRRTLRKTGRHLRALMVGHLRDEKSPRTYFEAARRLAARHDILLDHIGGDLDPALGAEARALVASQPQYRWLGALPHAATRARIQAAHVLVHPSQMEGGAQVVIEALTAGTPCWRPASPATWACWATATVAYSTGATRPGWPGCWHRPATIPLCCRRCKRNAPRVRRCSTPTTSARPCWICWQPCWHPGCRPCRRQPPHPPPRPPHDHHRRQHRRHPPL